MINADGLLRDTEARWLPDTSTWAPTRGFLEESLGLSGDDILYVGDHIFTDVNISKNISRWRTALIVRNSKIRSQRLTNSRLHMRN